MKNMHCPKCHSTEVIRLPGGIQPPSTLSGAKTPSSFKAINTTQYCCANCGYSEVWVDNPEDLKALLKKFGF
jgi:predicted nucleic-acid-binding Zn-ribbon protein